MKFAEDLGYSVGDVFVYDVNVDRLIDLFNSDFNLSGELTLVEDDGSSCPKFRQGDVEAYEDLELLKKIKDKSPSYADFVGIKSFFPDGSVEEVTPQHEKDQQEVTETVTKCQVTAIQEMLLACFDDKISVEISMDSIKVKWRGLTFVVDEEVSLEQILNAVNLLSFQQVEG